MKKTMPAPLLVSLEAIRTDGWFERIGEGIGSFQALCDIVGARFFAFAMITGARITSLTSTGGRPTTRSSSSRWGRTRTQASPENRSASRSPSFARDS
jgi:hypothetical protein